MNPAHILALILLSAITGFSQNSPPVISSISVSFDDVNKQITVNFDVSDNESDNIEINVFLSDNYGETFLAEMTNVQGDAGYPIAPGSNKQVTFNYNNSQHPVPGWMVKVVADDRQPVDIQQMVNRIDSVQLRNTLSFMEGIRHYQTGTMHLEEVKDFIEAGFRQRGLLTYRQNFNHNNYPAANIISWHPGVKNERIVYIIDAHFDTVNNSPGADDNASGVAGVLEAARILSQYAFEHTIKFIAFDFEESSPTLGLTGSLQYVAEGIKSHEQLEGVFNLEMIGYYSEQPYSQDVPSGFNIVFPAQYQMVASDSFRGNFVVNVAVYPSDGLRQTFDNAAAQYVPALKVISFSIPDTLNPLLPTANFWRSDHASFWLSDYKAIMLTDGADFRNHNYHTPNDTMGALNFTFMSNIVKATIASVASLAKPVHATSAVAYLIDTGMESGPESCGWRSVHSEAGIVLYPDRSCSGQSWIVALFDVQGKKVFQAKSENNKELMILRSAFPAGLYFMTADNGVRKASLSLILR